VVEDLVSIIIPVYNAEKYIKQTIETIKGQVYGNWEAVFVDDCSTDKSAEIIKKDVSNKIKLIKLNKNSGPAIARNIGIEVSEGKYVCFLDADDLWKKDKLEKQINFMKKKNCAFSYTSYYYIDDEGEKCSKKVEIPDTLNYKEALKNTRILTITAMFDMEKIKKDLLNKIQYSSIK